MKVTMGADAEHCGCAGWMRVEVGAVDGDRV